MIDSILHFFSSYLIEFMGIILTLGLVFRALSYQSGRLDDIYYSTFGREIEKILEDHHREAKAIHNIDEFLDKLLVQVTEKLPKRTLRLQGGSAKKMNSTKHKNVVSLRDYVKGQKGFIYSIKSETNAFKCPHPPNYRELTARVLGQDKNWTHLFGVIPIDSISRMIDILPGLFIVFGVFGTFIGIGQALPEIAKIDFDNIEKSGEILSNFVFNVTFAMKTSIAGILFSIILTILNTLFPIHRLRMQTFKKMSNSFESIWLAIHGTTLAAKETNVILEKILSIAEGNWTTPSQWKKGA